MHTIFANTTSLFSARAAGATTQQAVRLSSTEKLMCVLQGQHVHLHDGEGQVVTAQRGTLWITQDGNVRDWILEAGESVGFDRHADVLITAMSDAAIRLGSESRSMPGERGT